jgi:hypothetical protein
VKWVREAGSRTVQTHTAHEAAARVRSYRRCPRPWPLARARLYPSDVLQRLVLSQSARDVVMGSRGTPRREGRVAILRTSACGSDGGKVLVASERDGVGSGAGRFPQGNGATLMTVMQSDRAQTTMESFFTSRPQRVLKPSSTVSKAVEETQGSKRPRSTAHDDDAAQLDQIMAAEEERVRLSEGALGLMTGAGGSCPHSHTTTLLVFVVLHTAVVPASLHP